MSKNDIDAGASFVNKSLRANDHRWVGRKRVDLHGCNVNMPVLDVVPRLGNFEDTSIVLFFLSPSFVERPAM
jgi:hypothetical protein